MMDAVVCTALTTTTAPTFLTSSKRLPADSPSCSTKKSNRNLRRAMSSHGSINSSSKKVSRTLQKDEDADMEALHETRETFEMSVSVSSLMSVTSSSSSDDNGKNSNIIKEHCSSSISKTTNQASQINQEKEKICDAGTNCNQEQQQQHKQASGQMSCECLGDLVKSKSNLGGSQTNRVEGSIRDCENDKNNIDTTNPTRLHTQCSPSLINIASTKTAAETAEVPLATTIASTATTVPAVSPWSSPRNTAKAKLSKQAPTRRQRLHQEVNNMHNYQQPPREQDHQRSPRRSSLGAYSTHSGPQRRNSSGVESGSTCSGGGDAITSNTMKLLDAVKELKQTRQKKKRLIQQQQQMDGGMSSITEPTNSGLDKDDNTLNVPDDADEDIESKLMNQLLRSSKPSSSSAHRRNGQKTQSTNRNHINNPKGHQLPSPSTGPTVVEFDVVIDNNRPSSSATTSNVNGGDPTKVEKAFQHLQERAKRLEAKRRQNKQFDVTTTTPAASSSLPTAKNQISLDFIQDVDNASTNEKLDTNEKSIYAGDGNTAVVPKPLRHNFTIQEDCNCLGIEDKVSLVKDIDDVCAATEYDAGAIGKNEIVFIPMDDEAFTVCHTLNDDEYYDVDEDVMYGGNDDDYILEQEEGYDKFDDNPVEITVSTNANIPTNVTCWNGGTDMNEFSNFDEDEEDVHAYQTHQQVNGGIYVDRNNINNINNMHHAPLEQYADGDEYYENQEQQFAQYEYGDDCGNGYIEERYDEEHYLESASGGNNGRMTGVVVSPRKFCSRRRSSSGFSTDSNNVSISSSLNSSSCPSRSHRTRNSRTTFTSDLLYRSTDAADDLISDNIILGSNSSTSNGEQRQRSQSETADETNGKEISFVPDLGESMADAMLTTVRMKKFLSDTGDINSTKETKPNVTSVANTSETGPRQQMLLQQQQQALTFELNLDPLLIPKNPTKNHHVSNSGFLAKSFTLRPTHKNNNKCISNSVPSSPLLSTSFSSFRHTFGIGDGGGICSSSPKKNGGVRKLPTTVTSLATPCLVGNNDNEEVVVGSSGTTPNPTIEFSIHQAFHDQELICSIPGLK